MGATICSLVVASTIASRQLLQDKTYADAECNGDIVIGVASPFKHEAKKFNTFLINSSDVTGLPPNANKIELPTLPNKKRTKIRAIGIQPCTNVIYTLLGDQANKDHLLGILSNPFDVNDPYSFNISIIGAVNITDDYAMPGMAFNNEGMLFSIHLDGRIFEIDTTTGMHNRVDQRLINTGSACGLGGVHCREVLGFNWDNELFCRISSSDVAGNNFMECFEIGGAGMQLFFDDASELCDTLVRELTYIGYDLWLMMCADATSTAVEAGIRLLDTSSGTSAKVSLIGTQFEVSSGGGIIASITDSGETVLCEPQCPTSSPTNLPTAKTNNPTMDPTDSNDESDGSDDSSVSGDAAYKEEISDLSGFEENNVQHDYTIRIEPYYIYACVFMVFIVNICVCAYCYLNQK